MEVERRFITVEQGGGLGVGIRGIPLGFHCLGKRGKAGGHLNDSLGDDFGSQPRGFFKVIVDSRADGVVQRNSRNNGMHL